MSDERLPGLYMTSVHREKSAKTIRGFIERVLDRFGRDSRCVQLLFQVRLTSLARENKVVICGFVNDHDNASLKRSALLGTSTDDLLCKAGVGKLQLAGSVSRSPQGSHTYKDITYVESMSKQSYRLD